MTIKYKIYTYILIFICYDILLPFALLAQENAPPPVSIPQKLTLVRALVCEDIKNREPFNQAIVFSISIGKISCFTSFDPVPEKTIIYHNWFRMDKLSDNIRLILNQPRWATYSTIQLRETDKGPWRVEITDQDGNIFKILRFSITD